MCARASEGALMRACVQVSVCTMLTSARRREHTKCSAFKVLFINHFIVFKPARLVTHVNRSREQWLTELAMLSTPRPLCVRSGWNSSAKGAPPSNADSPPLPVPVGSPVGMGARQHDTCTCTGTYTGTDTEMHRRADTFTPTPTDTYTHPHPHPLHTHTHV